MRGGFPPPEQQNVDPPPGGKNHLTPGLRTGPGWGVPSDEKKKIAANSRAKPNLASKFVFCGRQSIINASYVLMYASAIKINAQKCKKPTFTAKKSAKPPCSDAQHAGGK